MAGLMFMFLYLLKYLRERIKKEKRLGITAHTAAAGDLIPLCVITLYSLRRQPHCPLQE
jgi:hypothetical protein